MVAVDWRSLGGPLDRPAGVVEWPDRSAVSEPVLTLTFDTRQLPSRVVLYSYPEVGRNGVPDETDGREERCLFAEGSATCWYQGREGEEVRVFADRADLGEFLVLHAAWPVLSTQSGTDDVDMVSGSWLLRIDP